MTAKNGIGPGTIEIDGEALATETFEYAGTLYTVREITVDEGDQIGEATTGPDGKINFQLNTRMSLSKGLVTPPTSIEQIGKFGSRKFGLVLRTFNRLNSLPEANPTPPAGSAGPTSPAGGESSPTI